MVVDDSRMICMQMKNLLQGTDYEVAAYCRDGEEAVAQYGEVAPDLVTVKENSPSLGSEDFAYVSTKVPSMMVSLGAGSTDQGFHYALHSPFVTPDESCLPVGAALYAHCAAGWLAANADK